MPRLLIFDIPLAGAPRELAPGAERARGRGRVRAAREAHGRLAAPRPHLSAFAPSAAPSNDSFEEVFAKRCPQKKAKVIPRLGRVAPGREREAASVGVYLDCSVQFL